MPSGCWPFVRPSPHLVEHAPLPDSGADGPASAASLHAKRLRSCANYPSGASLFAAGLRASGVHLPSSGRNGFRVTTARTRPHAAASGPLAGAEGRAMPLYAVTVVGPCGGHTTRQVFAESATEALRGVEAPRHGFVDVARADGDYSAPMPGGGKHRAGRNGFDKSDTIG